MFSRIVRTSYHLFQFMEYVKRLRRFGRLLKKTISNWYLSKSIEDLAYQVIKYQGRAVEEKNSASRWSHKDVIRLVHPKVVDTTNEFSF